MTVVVATRDRGLVPEAVFAAAAVAEPGGRLRVYVPEATGAKTFSNLEETGVVSVLLERPLTHRSAQFKGRFLAIRPARESERPLVEWGITRFFEEVESYGIPPGTVRRANRWPCRVIGVAVESVFDQTPGPRAGMPYGA